MHSGRLRKPEILAPAGCMQRLQTAFAFGADAVYIGGTKFSLRKNADNFNLHEMRAAIDYAHALERKVYVTVNVFPLQRDMTDLPAYLAQLQDVQPDALIISDLGVLRLAAAQTDISLHVSTQASVLHAEAARWWQQHGAKRIVAGRELSIAECRHIRETCGIEIESFCHGSMCTSHSGKCVISNYTAGRDSNRGGCVQTCRYEFEVHDPDSDEMLYESPIMNSKDLMSLHLLPQFIEAGIDSLKIEGRMKSELYVAAVVGAYRRILDAVYEDMLGRVANYDIDAEAAEIERMSNRQFTSGSLEQRAFAESINYAFPGYQKSHAFAGQVVEVLPDEALLVQVRHPLDQGQNCDFVTPNGVSAALTLNDMRDVNGQSVGSMPPNRIMRLPFVAGVPVLSVLRLQLSEVTCHD